MASYHKSYPIGSVSSNTMQSCDLIPTFLRELDYLRRHASRTTAKGHTKLIRDIERRMKDPDYYEDFDTADSDLEALFDALECYAGPYFYFGAHPEEGADYGFWLCERFEDDFEGLKVSDTSEVPKKYRGEVLCVNDHGNCMLYVATSRGLREVWSIV